MQTRSSSAIIDRVASETGAQFRDKGLEWVRVGWDDCTRGFGSSIGPNISDWSFQLKDGTTLQFLRGPNYTDKTLTLPARDVAVVVGNERPGGNLRAVTFADYLKNYGKYTPGVPDNIDLSNGDDELVTVRYIAVVVPEDQTGSQEVVPTSYNYQTTSAKNPKNIIGASFHLGISSRTDGPGCEKVFLVKNNAETEWETCNASDLESDSFDSLEPYADQQTNTWFRITNEHRETEQQREAVGTVLGTRSTGVGRNRVQCFQIPRVQERRSLGRPKGLSCLESCDDAAAPVYRGLSMGNVSYGTDAGSYTRDGNLSYVRDKTQNVTITFAYYFTTSDGHLTPEEVTTISDTINNSYRDAKAHWVGSLVTGEKDQSVTGTVEQAPIELPQVSKTDLADYNQKVTHFPKNSQDVTVFPD